MLLTLAACLGTDSKPGPEGADTQDTAPEDGETDTAEPPETGDAATEVVPELLDGRWVFVAGELRLEVDPDQGARIATFALGGVDLLTDATVDGDNWGATFWTSPQSAWSWPPPAAIDSEPYTAALDGATLTLVSGPAEVGDATFVVEKRVTVGTVATITYTLRNGGTTEARVAAWQVTRVPAEGTTFFPAGAYVTPAGGSLAWEEADGHVWISEVPAEDAKLLADGSDGWLAHVANGVLLVQRFPDVRLGGAAPGDAEVEVFANGGGGYREIEAQSEYTTLAPGESLVWTVTWEAREVPVGVEGAGLVGLVGG